MTEEHQETRDNKCQMLDEEQAEQADPAEEAAQPEQEEEAGRAEQTEQAEQADSSQQDLDFEPTVESVVEAVLFASDEPLSEARLANIVETDVKQVRRHIESLNDRYQANNNAFRIEQIAGGYQMLTLSPYNYWLKKLLRARSDTKLSPAALETLAIIAYKQPVMRADIEVIRGVAAGEVIRSLCYKGMVKIVGRAEVLGRPMLYGTTKKFLEVFGLNRLKDLPKIEELKKPPS
jgi:segregation and condensation protein B